MLLFCPTCANTLVIGRHSETGQNALRCNACPYEFVLKKAMYERRKMKNKEVEDVLGGEGSWDNVDQTDAQCPDEECGGTRAYFYMVQIRSADEPMTTFFRCTKCTTKWKEN
ncbi:hypothetical protein BJ508DRAFT_362035 [Ascobolus immersus RN42]|uniref:DNA-directed RNA polymerase subunit n=1 Tax=Ascobolus immersus RN42 TaxID=1160509 RepID=A0A3N4IHU1_ASCIM|nr:hypothetical protein BJ508DRAFT_362035 [Ascobolus immersus RN42]